MSDCDPDPIATPRDITEAAAAEGQTCPETDAEAAVASAISIVQKLPDVARDAKDLGVARQIFELLNARLYLSFDTVQVKKRKLNKIKGGVVTCGDAPPPIETYTGPTAGKKVKRPTARDTAGPGEPSKASPTENSVVSRGKEGLSGNASRGGKIRLELFADAAEELEPCIWQMVKAA